MRRLIDRPCIVIAAGFLSLLTHAANILGCPHSLTLQAAQGGLYDLCASSGKPTLLAFLHVLPDHADTLSRSQAVFLSSIYKQYGRRGLMVMAVATDKVAVGPHSSRLLLVNAAYDWQLAFPLLEDENRMAKKAFGITSTPSALLLDASGNVVERWNGLASSSTLARAVETLLGGPLGQLPGSSIPPSVTP